MHQQTIHSHKIDLFLTPAPLVCTCLQRSPLPFDPSAYPVEFELAKNQQDINNIIHKNSYTFSIIE